MDPPSTDGGKLFAALPWSCGAGQVEEALQVVKPGPLGGGVLCCRD